MLVADSGLGQILTAANGMTVYLFMPDAQGAPTCTDACAQAWPPLTVDDASQVTGGDGVDASLLGTAEHPAPVPRSRTTAGRSTSSRATPPRRHQRSGSGRRVVRARPDRQRDRQRLTVSQSSNLDVDHVDRKIHVDCVMRAALDDDENRSRERFAQPDSSPKDASSTAPSRLTLLARKGVCTWTTRSDCAA